MSLNKLVIGMFRNAKLYAAHPDSIAWIRKLQPDLLINVEVIPPFDGPGLSETDLAALQSVEILLAEPRLVSQYNLQHQLPNLKWMHSFYAGVDALTRNLQKPLNFVLTRNGGHFGKDMARYVLGFILSREIKFSFYRENQDKNLWMRQSPSICRDMSNLTVGIVGFGDIGKEVAKALKSLDLKVWGLVRTSSTEGTDCPFVDRTLSDLPELLSSCDYIISLLPSVASTDGFFDGDVLSHCKNKKSVFMNLGRGNVVKEQSILKALDEGWLSHAVLDVFQPEPLPATSGLWRRSDVTITPHIAFRNIADKQFAEDFLRNYKSYIEGKPMEFVVDWTKGY